jgi:hypothetical protein
MCPQNTSQAVLPAYGIDRLELSIQGKWNTKRYSELVAVLPLNEQLAWRGESIVLKRGNKKRDRGPLPEGRILRTVEGNGYQVDLFDHSPKWACRLLLLKETLLEPGWEATARKRLSRFGLDWQQEQVDRLDLRCDVVHDFDEFKRRVPSHVVTRAMPSKKFAGQYETTVYYGSKYSVMVRIYDKELELIANEQPSLISPLTRIEFECHRDWLVAKGAKTLASMDCGAIWNELTSRYFWMTSHPRATKNPKRTPMWPVWAEIAATGRRPAAWIASN